MDISEIARDGALQLARCVESVDEAQLGRLCDAIVDAKRVYVYAAGRSMLMVRCLAMRLMHLGLVSYVVGETTTPAFGPGDLLIVASGSGSTMSVVNMARKAKELGGVVAVLTINAASVLGELANCVVEIPAYTDKVAMSETERPLLPGGSMFEQSVLLLGDALVLPLSERSGVRTDRAFALHANLE